MGNTFALKKHVFFDFFSLPNWPCIDRYVVVLDRLCRNYPDQSSLRSGNLEVAERITLRKNGG